MPLPEQEWGVELSVHQQPNPATKAYVEWVHTVAANPKQARWGGSADAPGWCGLLSCCAAVLCCAVLCRAVPCVLWPAAKAYEGARTSSRPNSRQPTQKQACRAAAARLPTQFAVQRMHVVAVCGPTACPAAVLRFASACACLTRAHVPPLQGVAGIVSAMVPCLRLYAYLACQLAQAFPEEEHEYTGQKSLANNNKCSSNALVMVTGGHVEPPGQRAPNALPASPLCPRAQRCASSSESVRTHAAALTVRACQPASPPAALPCTPHPYHPSFTLPCRMGALLQQSRVPPPAGACRSHSGRDGGGRVQRWVTAVISQHIVQWEGVQQQPGAHAAAPPPPPPPPPPPLLLFDGQQRDLIGAAHSIGWSHLHLVRRHWSYSV